MDVLVAELHSPLTDDRGRLVDLPGGPCAMPPVTEPPFDDRPGPHLTDRLKAAIASGREAVVLDLSGIEALAPSEVQHLTALVWTVLTEGAQPVLVIASREVRDAVEHVKMHRTFAIHDDRDTALAHLRGLSR